MRARVCASRQIAVLLMLAALAARLAIFHPDVPVPHWHGGFAAVAPLGAFPHPGHESRCGFDSDFPPGDSEQFSGYFSSVSLPADAGFLVATTLPAVLPEVALSWPATEPRRVAVADENPSRAPPVARRILK